MNEHVLVDLDSTLCDTRHRWKHSPIDPKTGEWRVPAESAEAVEGWEEYSMYCFMDQPILGVMRIVEMLHSSGSYVHIVSGRDECALDRSRLWLDVFGVPYHTISLKRKGADWGNHKVNIINEFRRGGINPTLFIEDWPKMAEEIEAAGVPVLRVRPPYKEGDVLWPKYAM